METTEWMKSKHKNRNSNFWIPKDDINFTINKKYSNNKFSILFEENKDNYNGLNYSLKGKRKIKTADDINKKYNYIDKIEDINSKNSIESKKNKEIEKLNCITKIKQIKLSCLDNTQKNILKEWINECDKVYNFTIDMFNNKDPKFNLNYMKMNKYILDELYKDKKLAPYDTLNDEIQTVANNIKSCLTQLKNKNINYFTKKHIIRKRFRSILVRKNAISINGIFSSKSYLGKQELFKELITEIPDRDCRLIYDFKKDEVYLNIPYYSNKIISSKNNKNYDKLIKDNKDYIKSINKISTKLDTISKYKEEILKDINNIKKENQLISNRKNLVALDPGEKIFQTFYSSTECGKIGENIRIPILKYQKKIKKYQKLLSENKNEINGKSIKHKKQLNDIGYIMSVIINNIKDISYLVFNSNINRLFLNNILINNID